MAAALMRGRFEAFKADQERQRRAKKEQDRNNDGYGLSR
jgi:hypothetical protein